MVVVTLIMVRHRTLFQTDLCVVIVTLLTHIAGVRVGVIVVLMEGFTSNEFKRKGLVSHITYKPKCFQRFRELLRLGARTFWTIVVYWIRAMTIGVVYHM